MAPGKLLIEFEDEDDISKRFKQSFSRAHHGEANKVCARCGEAFFSIDPLIFHCSDCLSYRFTTLSKSLHEATEQVVSSTPRIKCPQCGGNGKLGSWGNRKNCSKCHGVGRVKDYSGVKEQWAPGYVYSPSVALKSDLHDELDVDLESTLEPLTENMRRQVKNRLPSDFDSKCCYITSACLEDLGLSTDSLEMTAVKILTKGHILRSFKGKRDYLTYARRAPAIVQAIRASSDFKRIWTQVYVALNEVTSAVASKRYEEGYQKYKSIVLKLERLFGRASN